MVMFTLTSRRYSNKSTILFNTCKLLLKAVHAWKTEECLFFSFDNTLYNIGLKTFSSKFCFLLSTLIEVRLESVTEDCVLQVQEPNTLFIPTGSAPG